MSEMRSIFHIYSEINVPKPTLLYDYIQEYTKIKSAHISYKLPTYYNADKMKYIIESFEEACTNANEFELTFDKIFVTKKNSNVLMLEPTSMNQSANTVQQLFIDAVSKYGEGSVKEKFADFENNFRPHITIAAGIDDEMLARITEALPKDMSLTTLVDSATIGFTYGNDATFSAVERVTFKFGA